MPDGAMVQLKVLVPRPLKRRVAIALAAREQKLSPWLRTYLEGWIETIEKEQSEKNGEKMVGSHGRC
jgi:hypothetical protein